jgi:hypothetical protein
MPNHADLHKLTVFSLDITILKLLKNTYMLASMLSSICSHSFVYTVIRKRSAKFLYDTKATHTDKFSAETN